MDDSRWAMPVAMAHWIDGRYSNALASLLEPSVVQASDSLWLYHNLVGMVARQLDGQSGPCDQAFERSISLMPIGQIPSTTLPICSRMMTLIVLSCFIAAA